MRGIFDTLLDYGIIGALPFALCGCAVYMLIRALYLRKTRKPRAGAVAETARVLLVWFLVTLVIVVWFPLFPPLVFGKISLREFTADTFFFGEYTSNNRFLYILRGQFSALRDFELLANIVLFVPYGILLCTAFRRLKWWAVMLISLGTTVCVEIFQPFFGRSCDVDDIIANTLGALIGCITAKIVICTADFIKRHRRTE